MQAKILLYGALVAFLTILSPSVLKAQNTKATAEKADEFFESFWNRDTTTCLKAGDSLMHIYVKGVKLLQIRDELIAQFGNIKQKNKAVMKDLPEYTEVSFAVVFERASYNFVVNVSKKIEVVGFFLRPIQQTDLAAKYAKPVYEKPNDYTETSLVLKSKPYELPAVLTFPKGKKNVPIVVVLHGSGPQDMDGTIFSTKMYRDLAVGLAAQGVACLRFTKRTKAFPDLVSTNIEALTVQDEVVIDALAALEMAENIAGIDKSKVFLLGHSLGAMLAPIVAQQYQKEAGLILMAGTTRPLEDLILEQTTYLSIGDTSQNAQLAISVITEQVQNVKANAQLSENFYKELPLGLPVNYWLSLSKIPLEASAKAYQSKPILLMQGQRDYQVTMKDFEIYQRLLGTNPKAVFKTYEKLNHLFMAGEGKSMPSEYYAVTNVPEEVVQDIANFIKKTKK